MRLEKSYDDAFENRRSETVILVPRVWSWSWRLGVSLLLIAMAFETIPALGSTSPDLAGLGIVMILVGLIGPYVPPYVGAWKALLSSDK